MTCLYIYQCVFSQCLLLTIIMLWGNCNNQISSYNFMDMSAPDSHNLKSKTAYEETKVTKNVHQ